MRDNNAHMNISLVSEKMNLDAALKMKLTGKYVQHPISEELRKSIEEGPPATESNSKAFSFTGLQTYNPIFDYIWRSHSKQPGQWFGTKWRISQYKEGTSVVEDSSNSSLKVNATCFRKVVHLLDPIAILQDKYTSPKTPGLPWHPCSTYAAINKVQSPHNQAYVDAFGSYLCSRLREENISPHFALHYGSLVAMSEKYLYNITDDFNTYKQEKWFWSAIKNKNITIHILDASGAPITDEETINEIMSGCNTPIEVEEVVIETAPIEIGEIETIEDYDVPCIEDHGDSMSANRIASEIGNSSNRKNKKDEAEDDSEDDSEDEEDGEDEDDQEINLYIEFNKMPTIMSFYEKQEGSMDDLMYDNDEVGAECGTKAWEERWTAWLFQIIIALSQMQSIYNMTHNDLHTNNVLWSPTDKEYIYYKSVASKQIYKVPTYGKIFRIIDFGRAIYDVNDKTMLSDDYLPGNDAGDMYNFGYIEDPDMPEVLPNPSFDLARLAVSCIEGLFPKFPAKRKEKPKTMSKEEGRTMWETISPLFNLLWSWVVTDEGENILLDEENNDRYPGFELYILIAQAIHSAVPSEQINKPLFHKFKWNKNVSGNSIIYPIY